MVYGGNSDENKFDTLVRTEQLAKRVEIIGYTLHIGY